MKSIGIPAASDGLRRSRVPTAPEPGDWFALMISDAIVCICAGVSAVVASSWVWMREVRLAASASASSTRWSYSVSRTRSESETDTRTSARMPTSVVTASTRSRREAPHASRPRRARERSPFTTSGLPPGTRRRGP
ncbi:hypothetical protein [Salana multivorans]